MAGKRKFNTNSRNTSRLKKVSKETQYKILSRLNDSYEIFKKLEKNRLIEVLKLGTCVAKEEDEFSTFRLSNTDKMALHKALKEAIIKEQKENKDELANKK